MQQAIPGTKNIADVVPAAFARKKFPAAEMLKDEKLLYG